MKKIMIIGVFLLGASLGAMTPANIEPGNRAFPPQIFVLRMANSQTPAPVVHNSRAAELEQQAQNLMPQVAELASHHGESVAEYQARRFAGSPVPN